LMIYGEAPIARTASERNIVLTTGISYQNETQED